MAEPSAAAHKQYELEDPSAPSWRRHRRHLLIFSSAGKPIFSRFGEVAKLGSLVATLKAAVGAALAQDDELLYLHAGAHTVVFLPRGPITLVAASSCGDTVAYLSSQLQMMHLQLLSVLTSKVEEVFVQDASFDLRPLLGGTDRLMRALISQAAVSPSFLLNALPSVCMSPDLRADLTRLLVESRPPSLLFALMISRGRLVTMLSAKPAVLAPSDALLLVNAVASSSSDAGQFREDQSWLPICLPQYNPREFVYAHISYIAESLCLVLISPKGDAFPELSAHRDVAVDRLAPMLPALRDALASPLPTMQPVAPELFHFVFKLRSAGQYTSPRIPPSNPYAQRTALKRLHCQYQLAHARLHAAKYVGESCWTTKHKMCRRPLPHLFLHTPVLPHTSIRSCSRAMALWPPQVASHCASIFT